MRVLPSIGSRRRVTTQDDPAVTPSYLSGWVLSATYPRLTPDGQLAASSASRYSCVHSASRWSAGRPASAVTTNVHGVGLTRRPACRPGGVAAVRLWRWQILYACGGSVIRKVSSCSESLAGEPVPRSACGGRWSCSPRPVGTQCRPSLAWSKLTRTRSGRSSTGSTRWGWPAWTLSGRVAVPARSVLTKSSSSSRRPTPAPRSWGGRSPGGASASSPTTCAFTRLDGSGSGGNGCGRSCTGTGSPSSGPRRGRSPPTRSAMPNSPGSSTSAPTSHNGCSPSTSSDPS